MTEGDALAPEFARLVIAKWRQRHSDAPELVSYSPRITINGTALSPSALQAEFFEEAQLGLSMHGKYTSTACAEAPRPR